MVEDRLQTEHRLGYFVADGRYWLAADQFNKSELEQLNKKMAYGGQAGMRKK